MYRDESYDDILDQIMGLKGVAKQLRRAMQKVKQDCDALGMKHKGIADDLIVKIQDTLGEMSDNPQTAMLILVSILLEALGIDVSGATGEPVEMEPDEMGEMEMAADEEVNGEGESGYQDVTDQRQPGKKALKPNPALWHPDFVDPGTAVIANRLNLGQGGRYGINLNTSNLDALFGHNAERPALVVPLNRNDVRARTQPQDNLNQAGFWDGNLKSPFAGWPRSRRGR